MWFVLGLEFLGVVFFEATGVTSSLEIGPGI